MLSHRPFVVSEFALVRAFKEILLKSGLSDEFADVVAQVHARNSEIVPRWSEFFSENCGGCRKDPETCDYLNPSVEQCPPETSPRDVRTANALMIETGRIRLCPAREGVSPE